MNEQSVPFFHYWNSISEHPEDSCYGVLFCEQTEGVFIGWFNSTTKRWTVIVRGYGINQELSYETQDFYGLKLAYWMQIDYIPKPQKASVGTKSNFLHEVVAAILESC
jgi:hypothetical protein